MRSLQSQVYLFPHPDHFLLAVHVPEHDTDWTEQGLRYLVCAFALRIPQLDVPIVALHWVHNRVELTLVNSGDEQLFHKLQLRAEQPDSLEYYTRLAVRTIGATPQFENQIKCARVDLQYASEQDLFVSGEAAQYDDSKLRPVSNRFMDFCKQ